MADEYHARQSGPYGFVKRVALKVLKREIAGDDDNVRSFIREALVASEFRHPNLAQVYEVGEIGGQLFIAMELVRGVSVAGMMRMLVERGKDIPRNVAVRIAIDTLDGLAHAHEAKDPDGKPIGLVHRDISPQNIMVSSDGAVKVVDFGIARAETAFGRTIAPRIKGKFSYMAPEQWESDSKLDPRADLFAVGVVLYEMTTGGVRLFRGDSPKDLYKAVVMDPIPDPRTRDPSYPEPLARIVMRALERGPSARWASARAMRTALVEFAQAENWSLTQKAVADALRVAVGPGEIEDRWEPVTGAESEAGADPNQVATQIDAVPRGGQEEVPTREDPGAQAMRSRVELKAPATAAGGAMFSLATLMGVAAVALIVGFFAGLLVARH
jgi:serine/threonine protein kinase